MSNALQSLSDATAAIVESAGRGVVRVEARRRLPASGFAWSADGVIVTAHHVIEDEENISVGLADDKSVSAKLVGRDPTTDVAVLRAAGTNATPLTQANFENLRVGHIVLALARPGQGAMATIGIVSALGDKFRTPMGGLVDRYLQSDITMYPGFSGGPLVDASGQVIGLNTSAVLRDTSLAIPLPTLKRVVETLLTHGRVRRGFVGVSAQPVRLPEALSKQLNQETGLMLMSVEAGGPAERAGLVLGDTLVALDGQPIRHLDQLMTVLAEDRIGQSVIARVIRGGQLQEIGVVVGERK